jgi:hypothetical protein
MSHSDTWLLRWLGELGFCGLFPPLATRFYLVRGVCPMSLVWLELL